jgi:amidase
MQRKFIEFRRLVASYSTFLSIISIVNASGRPAASIPVHWTDTGIPIGVQMIARFGREDLLIQLASQIEMTGSWQPSIKRP